MADVITRFKLETSQYDSKLRDASKELADIGKKAAEAGKDFDKFAKDSLESAKALGSIATSATNAKGKVQELVGAYNDVAKAYNKLTEDQKQSDFGKAMAGSLQELQGRIKEAKSELYGLDDAAKKVSSGGLFSGDKLSGMLQVFGGNLMTKGAMMIGNFAAEMGDMVKQGIEMAKAGEGIRIAFERLGRGDLLDGLREATHGTVTDLELMKAAVKFNDFKLPVEELGTMLAFAQQKAKDTGQSVDYMVDSIVTGLGRKSLMILDNLGLSAAEIKDRMKETGDMTKAVGAIIREQMAKAGEYVSTAADQATAADVRLKNAMTELGDALKPLTNDFSTFWTDIKIGGLNFLKDVVTPMLNQLTEAGRIANSLKGMSGNEQVNNQINILKNGSSRAEQVQFYRMTRNAYGDQIRDYNTMIANGGKMPGAGSGEARDVRWLQAQVGALRQMRDAFDKAAQEILWPKTNDEPPMPTITNPNGGTGGGGSLTQKETYVSAIGSIDEMKANVKELQDEFNKTADQSIRGQLLVAIDEAQKKLDYMSGKGMSLLGRQNTSLTEHLGLGFDAEKLKKDINPVDFDNSKIVEAIVEQWTKQLDRESNNEQRDKIITTIGKLQGSLGNVASGLKSVGIELPEEVNTLLGAIQGVGQIISGVGAIIELVSATSETANTAAIWANTSAVIALTAAMNTNSFLSFLPFARGGIVRAAGGTIIPGNSYSGDNLRMPIMDGIGGWAGVNSGELILNRSQQDRLASQLSDGGIQNLHLTATIKGTDIQLALNNTARQQGRGTYVTSR